MFRIKIKQTKYMKSTLLLSSEISRTASVTPNTAAEKYTSARSNSKQTLSNLYYYLSFPSDPRRNQRLVLKKKVKQYNFLTIVK